MSNRCILEIQDLQKNYGDRELLRIDHLSAYDGERIGLIGENGAGKSTMLAILAGEIHADQGTCRVMTSMAIIHQQGDAENMIIGRESALFHATDVREGLSGGERTRNRISAALAEKPGLLLADEPTTDLDGDGIRILREQLDAFSGTLILVSHDRALLQLLCGRIWYLEEGKITDFPGGYDAFQKERKRRRDFAQFEYEQYQREQKRLKESAQRMAERASSVKKAPTRMGNSEARLHKREWTDSVLQISHAKRTLQNRMEQMEKKERPRALPDIRMTLGVAHPIEAKTVLEVQCAEMTVGGKSLLSDTGFRLPTGSRTALLGANGCGKTTLLNQLMGQWEEAVGWKGKVRWNPAASVGWFDQHHDRMLRDDRTILENVREVSVHPESLARTVLTRLGFPRDDVFKRVSLLSGGERAKTALACLLLMDCNVLLLDEPTNHLDLFTLEALESLMSEYGGTILFVSHDESFVQSVATRVVRFEQGKLIARESLSEQTEEREPSSADRQIAITTLEMRMAVIASRLSAPKKGDHPEQLQQEYEAMADELRELKREYRSK